MSMNRYEGSQLPDSEGQVKIAAMEKESQKRIRIYSYSKQTQ